MSATERLESPLAVAILKTLAGFTLAAAAVTHLLTGVSPVLWGVLAGGAIQLANLAALIWLSTRIAGAEPRGAAFYALLFMMKIGLLIGTAIYMLKMLSVDPIGFLIGVALLMPAALVASALQQVQPSNSAEVKA